MASVLEGDGYYVWVYACVDDGRYGVADDGDASVVWSSVESASELVGASSGTRAYDVDGYACYDVACFDAASSEACEDGV